MNLSEVTPLVLTWSEAANLQSTCAALSWARQILVLDSGSTDETAQIAASFPNVRFVTHPFDDHTSQWNFGLDQIETEWTLALDADYVCSPALPQELETLAPSHDAYAAEFIYAISGHNLRGTLYPPRVILFKTRTFRYRQDGHTQLLDLGGAATGKLTAKIIHDDRKPLSRWLASQAKYAALEADKLLASPAGSLGWKDRLRRGVFFAPPLTFFYCLLWKRLILDGWPGIFYTLQRTYAELLLSLELVDRRLRGRESTPR